MASMDSAPQDGTRILLKCKAMHFNSSTGEYEHRGFSIVEGFWGRHYDGTPCWREWLGDEKSHSTNTLFPIAWAPIPEELNKGMCV